MNGLIRSWCVKAFLILFFLVAIVVIVGAAILSALQEAAERLGRAFSIPNLYPFNWYFNCYFV